MNEKPVPCSTRECLRDVGVMRLISSFVMRAFDTDNEQLSHLVFCTVGLDRLEEETYGCTPAECRSRAVTT